jgi:hypothetical protein
MKFKEIRYEGVDSIHLTQNRNHWQALVNTVMNPHKEGNFFIMSVTISFSRRTLVHWVSVMWILFRGKEFENQRTRNVAGSLESPKQQWPFSSIIHSKYRPLRERGAQVSGEHFDPLFEQNTTFWRRCSPNSALWKPGWGTHVDGAAPRRSAYYCNDDLLIKITRLPASRQVNSKLHFSAIGVMFNMQCLL